MTTGRLRVAVAVLASALMAGGCASETGDANGGSADCAAQIRVQGSVYTSNGFSSRRASEYGRADRAACHDVGKDAPGSVFEEDPPRVTVWTFKGYPAERVLGVEADQGSFEVFVADSVPLRERERIYAELGTRGTASQTTSPCAVVEFEGRTYRLTHRPKGAGPGVGRTLGEGRTRRCNESGGARVTVYSVNEESPARAITISEMEQVWLYTRRVQ